MIGEIGGTDEQKAAAFVKERVTKPVVGFIAGQTAPKGRRMGHAGAIISGSSGTAEEKLAAFEAAGIAIMRRPVDVVELLRARSVTSAKQLGGFVAGSLTLGIVKPDAVASGKTGAIVAHLEQAGFTRPRRPAGPAHPGPGRGVLRGPPGSARSTRTWSSS